MDETTGYRRAWVSTDQLIKVAPCDRIPDYDPEAGEHLWTWAVVFRAVPAEEIPVLDGESLLSIAGVFCFHCQALCTEEAMNQRCQPGPEALAVSHG